MTRHLIIFAACFLVGAAITAAIRTARHDAYAPPPMAPAPHAGHAEAAPPPMAPAPHAGHAEAAPPPRVSDPHAGHVGPSPSAGAPVNTTCAICGMPVDPAIPMATYQGKTIGFGCRACPPKFAADPDRYGPAALMNRVVEE